jgi:hypothetical protein
MQKAYSYCCSLHYANVVIYLNSYGDVWSFSPLSFQWTYLAGQPGSHYVSYPPKGMAVSGGSVAAGGRDAAVV